MRDPNEDSRGKSACGRSILLWLRFGRVILKDRAYMHKSITCKRKGVKRRPSSSLFMKDGSSLTLAAQKTETIKHWTCVSGNAVLGY